MAIRNAGRSVAVVEQDGGPRLSPGQKTFNTLIKDLERKRASLLVWEQTNTSYQKKYVEELLPLKQRFCELQTTMVHNLDLAWRRPDLKKTEKQVISDLIIEIAGPILAESDDKAELKAIYNRHGRTDFDTEVAAELDNMKVMAEVLFGVDANDDIVRSPDDLMQRIGEMFEQQAAAEYEAEARRDERQAKRKKSAKQLAAEARAQAEQMALSQSIREVYRKLAVALHPDRESDPQERARKTELMQRVNAAYNQRNLLQLLELQLELEHIDQSDLANISEDRLKHYNTILKEQLGDLKAELCEVEETFKLRFNLDPFRPITPGQVMRHLANDIASLRRCVGAIDRDLRVFADVKILKMWLKTVRRAPPAFRFSDMPF